MNAAFMVFLGGGAGSLLRYLIAKGSLRYFESNFPLGTFIANIISCIILAGILLYFQGKNQVEVSNLRLLLITGFCGGLSTFSTFSYETLALIRTQMWSLAILNVGLSLILGVGIIFVLLSKTS